MTWSLQISYFHTTNRRLFSTHFCTCSWWATALFFLILRRLVGNIPVQKVLEWILYTRKPSPAQLELLSNRCFNRRSASSKIWTGLLHFIPYPSAAMLSLFSELAKSPCVAHTICFTQICRVRAVDVPGTKRRAIPLIMQSSTQGRYSNLTPVIRLF